MPVGPDFAASMNTVVYYPHIWPSPAWLRLASLCWERVVLLGITNDGYSLAAPPEIADLDEVLGGVLDTSTTVAEIVDEELTERFKRWVEPRAAILRDQLSPERQDLFGVYDQKFMSARPGEAAIRDWLVEQGLASIEEPQDRERYGYDQEWDVFTSEVGVSHFVADTIVYLPKDIALHYMSLVAAKAADLGDRDLAADEQIFADTVFSDLRGVRGSVATSTMRAYLPRDFDRIEPRRLAELRAELASSRIRYQAEIQETVAKLGSVSSEGELSAVKGLITEIAQTRVEETKRTYRRSNLALATEAFAVTLTPPALVASITSALGVSIFAPAGIAAALSLFAVRSLLEHAESRASRAQNPWSYVLDVSRMAR